MIEDWEVFSMYWEVEARQFEVWLASTERQRMRETLLYSAADAARLRDVLLKVEKWFASEAGPIYYLYGNLDICNYDERECTWEEALEEVRDFGIPVEALGYGTEWPAVTLYREILAVLRSEQSEENETK